MKQNLLLPEKLATMLQRAAVEEDVEVGGNDVVGHLAGGVPAQGAQPALVPARRLVPLDVQPPQLPPLRRRHLTVMRR